MNNPQQLKERIYALNLGLSSRIDGSTISKILPIRLQNVLIAIQNSELNCVYYPARKGKEMMINICVNALAKEINYSLEKTFDQNISDNPELVEFLLNVIS